MQFNNDDRDANGNPQPLRVEPHLDQLVLRTMKRLLPQDLTALGKLVGSVHESFTDRRHNAVTADGTYPLRVDIKQPSPAALRFLSELEAAGFKMYANKAEISLDLIASSPSHAEDIHNFLSRHLIQSWCSEAPVRLTNTRYAKRRRWGNQKFKHYVDEARSMPVPATRLEWVIEGRQPMRRHGLREMANFLTLDHRRFWQPRLKLVAFSALKVGAAILGQRHEKSAAARTNARRAGSVIFRQARMADGGFDAQTVKSILHQWMEGKPLGNLMTRLDASAYLPPCSTRQQTTSPSPDLNQLTEETK